MTVTKHYQDVPKPRPDHLLSLVNTSPVVHYIARVSGDYGATFVSDSVRTELGYEPEEFLEDAGFWFRQIHPEDRSKVLAHLDHLCATDREELEYRFRRKDGRYIWLHGKVALIRDEQGKPVALAGYGKDISRQKQIEEALRIIETRLAASEEQAKTAHKVKSRFLANMSHELRTPLNAVIGYSELLKEGAKAEQRAQDLIDIGNINSAARHLLWLIDDILAYATIEAGAVEMTEAQFDVATLVGDVASSVKPLAQRRGNTLTVRCADAVGELYADEAKVRQCLVNLLGNAAKFTERGHITLAVEPKSKGGTNWITFEVSDTGIGMSREQVVQAVQPFVQADGSTTRRHGGTGLGLAITHGLAQAMGGDVNIKSAAGQGSTFVLWLPLVAFPDVEERRTAESVRRTHAVEDTPMILVVDDNRTVRQVMTMYLENAGYRVITAMNGGHGLRIAREQRPAVVILDLIMPETDGWTVLEILKKDADLNNIPVIVCTIVDEPPPPGLRAHKRLLKPVDKIELVDAVQSCLREASTAEV